MRRYNSAYTSVLVLEHLSVAMSTASSIKEKKYLHTPYRSKFTVASRGFSETLNYTIHSMVLVSITEISNLVRGGS